MLTRETKLDFIESAGELNKSEGKRGSLWASIFGFNEKINKKDFLQRIFLSVIESQIIIGSW